MFFSIVELAHHCHCNQIYALYLQYLFIIHAVKPVILCIEYSLLLLDQNL